MTEPPIQMNLARHVLTAGATTPDKIALAVLHPALEPEIWSYRRLIAAIRGTASGFLQAGLVPGDRILLRLGNRPAFPIAYLGAIAAGLVPVPSSAQLTAPEITRLAATIRPALVIAGDGIALPDHPAPVLPESALSGFAALPPAGWHMGPPDRLAYILFTSGSSGQPRAVAHAHRAILARRMMMEDWSGLRADDRLLHAGAFNWSFTLGTGLMDPWTIGATALIPADGTPPAAVATLAARHHATLLAGAPGVFRKMLQTGWPNWPALRHGLCAGERLEPALRQEWRTRTGTDLHEAMGMSECSTFLSGSPSRPAPTGTAGYPQRGRKVALLDDLGRPLGAGLAGRLAVSADDAGLCLGYLDQPQETAARITNGWFLTGDLAVAADDGAIAMLGRTDDLMNAGGFRVAPPEIETPLSQVAQAGDLAVAEITLRAGVSIIAAFWTGTAPEEALRDKAASDLAGYKQPRAYIHLDALPRTATGKINRRALRETHSKDRL